MDQLLLIGRREISSDDCWCHSKRRGISNLWERFDNPLSADIKGRCLVCASLTGRNQKSPWDLPKSGWDYQELPLANANYWGEMAYTCRRCLDGCTAWQSKGSFRGFVIYLTFSHVADLYFGVGKCSRGMQAFLYLFFVASSSISSTFLHFYLFFQWHRLILRRVGHVWRVSPHASPSGGQQRW